MTVSVIFNGFNHFMGLRKPLRLSACLLSGKGYVGYQRRLDNF